MPCVIIVTLLYSGRSTHDLCSVLAGRGSVKLLFAIDPALKQSVRGNKTMHFTPSSEGTSTGWFKLFFVINCSGIGSGTFKNWNLLVVLKHDRLVIVLVAMFFTALFQDKLHCLFSSVCSVSFKCGKSFIVVGPSSSCGSLGFLLFISPVTCSCQKFI